MPEWAQMLIAAIGLPGSMFLAGWVTMWFLDHDPNTFENVEDGNNQTMPYFDIAMIVTVQAESYDEAKRHADHLAEGVGMDGENISAVFDYEHDNDGQRVLYLHPETTDNQEQPV